MNPGNKDSWLWADVVLSWLIPGFGFLHRKRYVRGVLLFVVIEGTFVVGLVLHGAVSIPIINLTGGGIIGFLSFVIQLGNGILGLVSLWAYTVVERIREQGLDPTGLIEFFGGRPSQALFEMGGFYLLVSGAMNYFATMNFYDRYKKRGKKTSPESKGKA